MLSVLREHDEIVVGSHAHGVPRACHPAKQTVRFFREVPCSSTGTVMPRSGSTSGGTRIILDPFRSPDSGGYEPIAEAADVVVVSHENDRYHSHLGQIVPPFEVVRALELPP